MRVTGKIIIWLGIAVLVLAGAVVGLMLFVSAMDGATQDAFGWMIGLSMLLGIPAAFAAAILILVGAVLVTSAPRPTPHATAPPPQSPPPFNTNTPANKSRYVQATAEHGPSALSDQAELSRAIRAVASKPRSTMWYVVMGLRVVAIGILMVSFLPGALASIKYVPMVPNLGFGAVAVSLIADFIVAAIIPLIFWLISNVLRMKFQSPWHSMRA